MWSSYNTGSLTRPTRAARSGWRFLTLDKSCYQIPFNSRHEEDVHQWVCRATHVEKRDCQDLGHFVVHRDGKDGGDDGREPADDPRDNDDSGNSQQTSCLRSSSYHPGMSLACLSDWFTYLWYKDISTKC